MKKVSSEYYQYLLAFSKAESNKVILLRYSNNYYIILEEGKYPEDLEYNPLYKMLLSELKAYKEYI